jgi:uncharacterized protein
MTHIKTIPALRVLALGLILLAAGAQAQDSAQPKLPTVSITAGMHVIQAEVAKSAEQQMVGLMHRRELPGNEGMIFVNADASTRCFWMRNTLVPLTIAFIADDGSIVNLADMQPRSEASHCSTKPVRFSLEMSQGWFAKRGIGPGFKLRSTLFKN